MSTLKHYYQTVIIPRIQQENRLSSVMLVPRLEKVVVNIGVGDATKNAALLEAAFNELSLITNQKPVITKAKKSISNYKLREGQAIGVMVTLRGEKMWNFVEKLVNIALPRVRDFRGFSVKSFDGRGNLTIGIKEQIIFHEVNYDAIKKIRGMDVSFVTSTSSDHLALNLLASLGLVFNDKG